MGKVSKRKFAQMARLFQRTGAMATGSKGGSKFKHINPLPSRDKLLLGDEPTSDGEVNFIQFYWPSSNSVQR